MHSDSKVKKGFNRKHLIIMALGNIIGSGIFLASGAAISVAGPSVVLAYVFGGLVMLLEVMFIAEMTIVNPAPGSFRVHASEIFGRGMGFVNGWMFWCSGVLGMASEVTAAAIFSSYWFPHVPLWAFCLLYSILMSIINLMDARGLSRIEMWLASVKVIALAAFILFGFYRIFLHPAGSANLSPIFQTYGSFFPNGLKGFFSVMLLVLFSYTGTGIIGIAITETGQPEKNVPPAIHTITATVISLYVISVLIMVLVKPWSAITASGSPFVQILQAEGINVGSGILNFIVLTASLSGLNSAMYSASRMLYSLGKDGQGPKIFVKVNKNGVPSHALAVTSGILALTAFLSYMLPEKTFILLVGASGFTALFNWLIISITHYFYRKKTLRENPSKLKYKVPGYPGTTLLAVVLIAVILATSPLYPDQVASLTAGIIILVLIIMAYRLLKHTGKIS